MAIYQTHRIVNTPLTNMPKTTKSENLTQTPVDESTPKETKKRVAKETKDKTVKGAQEVKNVVKEKVAKATRTKKKNVKVEAEAEPTVDESQDAPTGGNPIPKKRSFNVLRVTRDGQEEEFKSGRFHSKTPAGAARKAANQACKTLYGDEDNCSIDITIKETSRNHSGKEYSYRATRTLNTKDVPFKGTSGQVNIPFKYAMKLNSLKKTLTGATVVDKDVTDEAETIQESGSL
jgi:hypothetical protein